MNPDGPPWQSTLFDAKVGFEIDLWVRRWVARTAGVNPLFKLPGVTAVSGFPDLMHIKHQGTDQYFLGSVLKELVAHIMGGHRRYIIQTHQDAPS